MAAPAWAPRPAPWSSCASSPPRGEHVWLGRRGEPGPPAQARGAGGRHRREGQCRVSPSAFLPPDLPLLGPAAFRAHLRVCSALGGETLREVSVPSALLARLANERACAAVISFSWALINRAAQSCFPPASRAAPAGNCAQGALGSTRSCRGALRAELSAYGAPAALCLTLRHSSRARKEPAADFGCGFFFSFSFCSQHKRCLGVVCEWKLYASVYVTA